MSTWQRVLYLHKFWFLKIRLRKFFWCQGIFFHDFWFQKWVWRWILRKYHAADPKIRFLTKSISKPYAASLGVNETIGSNSRIISPFQNKYDHLVRGSARKSVTSRIGHSKKGHYEIFQLNLNYFWSQNFPFFEMTHFWSDRFFEVKHLLNNLMVVIINLKVVLFPKWPFLCDRFRTDLFFEVTRSQSDRFRSGPLFRRDRRVHENLSFNKLNKISVMISRMSVYLKTF